MDRLVLGQLVQRALLLVRYLGVTCRLKPQILNIFNLITTILHNINTTYTLGRALAGFKPGQCATYLKVDYTLLHMFQTFENYFKTFSHHFCADLPRLDVALGTLAASFCSTINVDLPFFGAGVGPALAGERALGGGLL